jgi:ankyrin repeat protein
LYTGNEFIKKGSNVMAQNKNGETPLHKAIFNRKVRLLLVEMLLSKNASPNAKNIDGDTPLHYAVRSVFPSSSLSPSLSPSSSPSP